jgi:hypothetical protein
MHSDLSVISAQYLEATLVSSFSVSHSESYGCGKPHVVDFGMLHEDAATPIGTASLLSLTNSAFKPSGLISKHNDPARCKCDVK